MNHQDHVSEKSTTHEDRIPESKMEIFLKKCTKQSEIRYFKRIYRIGDTIYIKSNHQVEQLAQITNIYLYHQENNTIVPLIEVQWFCQAFTLPDSFNKEIFGESEIFLTEQQSILFIDCIMQHFTLYTIDEYENCGSDLTYFSRAKYNTITRQFDPPLEFWRKVCLCDQPHNPDQLYIQCDDCQKWFHPQCVDIQQEQALIIEQFKCNNCQSIKQ